MKIAVASSNLIPYAARFVRSIKSECLNNMLIFGETHPSYFIDEYMERYHSERPHQGIENNIITPLPQPGDGEIVCYERLESLLESPSPFLQLHFCKIVFA